MVLTLNSNVQAAAESVLEGYSGAVVVLDPSTGAVIACASSPGYDLNDLDAAMTDDSGSGALVNRATQALYAPGSTFKMVTLTALLENGLADADTQVDAPGSTLIGNAEVTNYNRTDYGTITVEQAVAVSSNTAFGALSEDVGPDLLVLTAQEFGFNSEIALDIPLYTSLMPDPDEMTVWETAWAACGQPVGEHASPAGPQATAMQMAMVAAAIANDGKLMQPYFVQAVYNAQGVRSFEASPQVYSTPMSADTANAITEMMVGVVNNGTGAPAAISGVSVAGKTGTAETNKEYNDSWFIGFAPADNPRVVVAVVIEEGVLGTDESGLASSRAQQVLVAALQEEGLL